MSGGNGKPADESRKEDKPKENGGTDASKRRPLWPVVLALVLVVTFLAIVLGIVLTPTPDVWTDDAYVQVHYASVAPRIAGQVVLVSADDNDHVAAGQSLVQLDDRDQRASLASAEAALDRDRAQFREALANVGRQPSLITQQSSQELSLQAQLGLARANQTRYRNLASTGAGTVQSRQTADAQMSQLEAEFGGAKASTEAARHQLDVLRAMADADRATIAADEAQVRQAQLNLSYTRIVAPLEATVTVRSVQVGDYVNPGGVLMSLVPLDRLYIVANYRELALRHVLPGQHVQIHVDAYNVDLDGVVQGIPPASGTIFSPVPSNNATGNFTKIVQRFPVKVLVTSGQRLARLLKAGLSVETTIHTGLANVKGEQAHSVGRVTVN